MKLFFSLTELLFLCVGVRCSTQSFDDKKIVNFLKNFYSVHEEIMYKDSVSIGVDSVYSRFCTEGLMIKARKLKKFDHDIYTDDWGITKEALKNIIIVKNASRDNSYIVSYFIDTYPVSPFTAVRKQVVLNLTIVDVEGGYKIDAVDTTASVSPDMGH
jgi:hypothetical protein